MSRDDIEDITSRNAFSNGERYWRQGRVLSLTTEKDDTRIKARVRGGRRQPYSLKIDIVDVNGELLDIVGECSCPVGFNCKHVARKGEQSATAPDGAPGMVLIRASDVTPKAVRYVWPNRFACGKFHMIAGEAGLGKTQLAVDMAKTVSTGGAWPCGEGFAPQGDVVFASVEDDLEDTMRPRLEAAGADLARVHFAQIKTRTGQRMFNLLVDLDTLGKKLAELDGKVRLVIIDPINACLSPIGDRRLNTNSVTDVRAALDPLAAFAAKHDIAVVGITHLTKAKGGSALARVVGSVAFGATARSVFIVSREKGTNCRIFAAAKNNLGPDMDGLAFEVEQRNLTGEIQGAVVAWVEPVPTTAEEAMVSAIGSHTTSSGAKEFLKELLRDGGMDQKDVVRAGKEAGFTERNLRTAREALGIKPQKEGFAGAGRWIWQLPSAPVLTLVVDNSPSHGSETPANGEHPHVQTPGDDEPQGAAGQIGSESASDENERDPGADDPNEEG